MKQLLRLRLYITRYKSKFILGLIFILLSNVCSAIYPRIVGATVDVFRGSFVMSQIWENLILFMAFTIGSGFFMFLTRKTIIVASRLIEYDVRKDFLTTIERQSSAYFSNTPTGVLMAHATNDIASIREFVGPAIMYTTNTLTTFIFTMTMMLSINTKLTLFAIIPLPFIALTTYFIGKKIHALYLRTQIQYEIVTTHSQEVFSGIRLVRAYGIEQYETQNFQEKSLEYRKYSMKLATIQALSMPLMMVLVGSTILIVLSLGGSMIINGTASIGTMTQFFIYLNQLVWPVAAIGWVTNTIQRAAASAGRLGVISDTPIAITNQTETKKYVRGDIQFSAVSLSYNADTQINKQANSEVQKIRPSYALTDISLTIPMNTSLGIVGSIGSGKSTLTRLIPRLYDPSSGTVTIGNIDIHQMDVHELRSHIAIVPQEPFLFSTTIEENIRMGKHDATLDEIIAASKMACLHDEVSSFNNGYSTVIGERGISLSGGQKQRLAIARALIRSSDILIFDDALSAVDTETEKNILMNIKNEYLQRIVIIVSHRLSSVEQCSNIIVLDNGSLIEDGTHNQLLSLNGYYADIFQKQKIMQELTIDVI